MFLEILFPYLPCAYKLCYPLFKESIGMKMETTFDHVWLVRDHVDKIVSTTGAGIRCPDVSNLKELPQKYSIWIRGPMDSVLLASVMLNVYFGLSINRNILF